MLKGRASQYFRRRDNNDPSLSNRRGYHALMLSIGQSIGRMRKINGLTQGQLASLMETSQSTIGLWETPGYSGYTVGKLYEISEKLGFKFTIEFVPKSEHVVMTFTQEASGWADNPAPASLTVQINKAQAKRLHDQTSTFRKEPYV